MTESKVGLKRPKSGGRKKGTPNKDTALIRDMIAKALDQVGGVDYLAGLAQTHPPAFASLIGRVIPVQLEGAGGGAVRHSLTVSFR